MITINFYTGNYFNAKHHFENEIFINMYDGYKISNYGRILTKYNRILKPYISPQGRLQIKISGVSHYLHRLVAFYFISNPENLPHVKHINKNIIDNRTVNLQWGFKTNTAGYNNLWGEDCNFHKLTKEEVRQIILAPRLPRKLGRKYGVHRNHITLIQNGKVWRQLFEEINDDLQNQLPDTKELQKNVYRLKHTDLNFALQ